MQNFIEKSFTIEDFDLTIKQVESELIIEAWNCNSFIYFTRKINNQTIEQETKYLFSNVDQLFIILTSCLSPEIENNNRVKGVEVEFDRQNVEIKIKIEIKEPFVKTLIINLNLKATELGVPMKKIHEDINVRLNEFKSQLDIPKLEREFKTFMNNQLSEKMKEMEEKFHSLMEDGLSQLGEKFLVFQNSVLARISQKIGKMKQRDNEVRSILAQNFPERMSQMEKSLSSLISLFDNKNTKEEHIENSDHVSNQSQNLNASNPLLSLFPNERQSNPSPFSSTTNSNLLPKTEFSDSSTIPLNHNPSPNSNETEVVYTNTDRFISGGNQFIAEVNPIEHDSEEEGNMFVHNEGPKFLKLMKRKLVFDCSINKEFFVFENDNTQIRRNWNQNEKEIFAWMNCCFKKNCKKSRFFDVIIEGINNNMSSIHSGIGIMIDDGIKKNQLSKDLKRTGCYLFNLHNKRILIDGQEIILNQAKEAFGKKNNIITVEVNLEELIIRWHVNQRLIADGNLNKEQVRKYKFYPVVSLCYDLESLSIKGFFS